MNDELPDLLRALPSRLRSPWVFPSESGARPLDSQNFYQPRLPAGAPPRAHHQLLLARSPPYVRVAARDGGRRHPDGPGAPRPSVARDDAALRAPLAGPQARRRPALGTDPNRHLYRHQRLQGGSGRDPATRTNRASQRRKTEVAAPWIEQGT